MPRAVPAERAAVYEIYISRSVAVTTLLTLYCVLIAAGLAQVIPADLVCIFPGVPGTAQDTGDGVFFGAGPAPALIAY